MKVDFGQFLAFGEVMGNSVDLRILASGGFSFVAILTLVMFPHGIAGISRLDHLAICISAIFFISLGRIIIDRDILIPYGFLLSAFSIPLIVNFNGNTISVAREFFPIIIGSYIIAWHVKNSVYAVYSYRILLALIGVDILLTLFQHLMWENYWLKDIYTNLYEAMLSPNENVHIGFGFSLTPEYLGWASLLLAVTVSTVLIQKNESILFMLPILILADIGMMLSGWRIVWLSYLVSLGVISILGRRLHISVIYPVVLFFCVYFSSSYLVYNTNLLSPDSLLVRGAEDRLVHIKSAPANSDGDLVGRIVQTESINYRMLQWDIFASISEANNVFGYGPGQYAYLASDIVSDGGGEDLGGAGKINYDPHNTILMVAVEYGLWALAFIFCSFAMVFGRLLGYWLDRHKFDVLEVTSLAMFVSVAMVVLTRSYLFNNVVWISLAFVVGTQAYIKKCRQMSGD